MVKCILTYILTIPISNPNCIPPYVEYPAHTVLWVFQVSPCKLQFFLYGFTHFLQTKFATDMKDSVFYKNFHLSKSMGFEIFSYKQIHESCTSWTGMKKTFPSTLIHLIS
jgi:hypothetical protein